MLPCVIKMELPGPDFTGTYSFISTNIVGYSCLMAKQKWFLFSHVHFQIRLQFCSTLLNKYRQQPIHFHIFVQQVSFGVKKNLRQIGKKETHRSLPKKYEIFNCP